MGNALLSPCCHPVGSGVAGIKLVFFEGTTRILTGKRVAGEIMFEFPEYMVCHADSFFIGHPIPELAMDDELLHGETYFVLPLDCFAGKILSASSVAALGCGGSPNKTLKANPPPMNLMKTSPFEYVKGSNGRVLIKVIPEFMTKLLTRGQVEVDNSVGSSSPSAGQNNVLCSTPELKKHYDQLVGSKVQVWSPKLETISEYKIRYSPCRFLGFEKVLTENS